MTLRKPPVAVPVPRLPRWRTLKSDGIAHAVVGTSALATACGVANQPERYDWGRRRSKCVACERVLAEQWDQADRESMVVPHVGRAR